MRFSFKKRDRATAEIRHNEYGEISLHFRTHYQHIEFYPLSVTRYKLSKIDILHSLAHELAHLYHWDHTPEHKLLECQLLEVFMYKLKSTGYKSEEEELK